MFTFRQSPHGGGGIFWAEDEFLGRNWENLAAFGRILTFELEIYNH